MRKGLPFAVLALLSTRPVVAQITGEFTPGSASSSPPGT